MIAKKQSKIDELADEVNKLEVFVDHYKDEIVRLKEKAASDQGKLKAEIEFMVNEQNAKELQISDVRHKLAKRSDEL